MTIMNDRQVIELRQYTLHGGQRDTLIALFEQQFIEPQNDLGAHVIGTFRDLDDPDRFVWMRGFKDLPTRARALDAFYSGPVWQAHRTEANVTMLDSDNVLQLRPARPGQGFPSRPVTPGSSHALFSVTIHYLGATDPPTFAEFFERAVRPLLLTERAESIAQFVTESTPNNYPRLPIREHESVFIWFARWPSAAAEQAGRVHFCSMSGWRDSAPEAVLPALMRKPERLRLVPTPHSALQ